MTTEQWLAQHAMTWTVFQATLLRDTGNVHPTLNTEVRSSTVLSVVIRGPTRQDGASDFTVTFNAVASDAERAVRGLFVQSYGDLAIPTRDLTARFLCNVIVFAEILGLGEITAVPRPANSKGHLRAGFLPIEASWDTLRTKMATRLRAEVVSSGEIGAISGVKAVLDSPYPQSIRNLLPDAGLPARAGVLWPRTSSALLDSMPSWYGRLDIVDADTLIIRRAFCLPHQR